MNLKKYYNLGKNILYPINRSITGDGTKKTLKIIKNQFYLLINKCYPNENLLENLVKEIKVETGKQVVAVRNALPEEEV